VGLLGRGISQSQGLCLHTGQHRQTIRSHISMPRMEFVSTSPGIQAGEDSSCLKPSGHCDHHLCKHSYTCSDNYASCFRPCNRQHFAKTLHKHPSSIRHVWSSSNIFLLPKEAAAVKLFTKWYCTVMSCISLGLDVPATQRNTQCNLFRYMFRPNWPSSG
jgi:hypothetical protein